MSPPSSLAFSSAIASPRPLPEPERAASTRVDGHLVAVDDDVRLPLVPLEHLHDEFDDVGLLELESGPSRVQTRYFHEIDNEIAQSRDVLDEELCRPPRFFRKPIELLTQHR